MEIKIQCDCGQKFKFDAEPVDGRMPWEVNCPVCGASGTDKANGIIAQAAPTTAFVDEPPAAAQFSSPIAAAETVPTGEAPKPRLTIRHHAPAPATTPAAPQPPVPRPMPMRAAPAVRSEAPSTNTMFFRGVLGAFIGALVGMGVWFGLVIATGYQIGIVAWGVGALTGFGARIMGKDGNTALGVVSALFAAFAILGGGTLAMHHLLMKEIGGELSHENLMHEIYTENVREAKEAGALETDAQIRAYLAKREEASESDITREAVETFKIEELPEMKELASGTLTEKDYAARHHQETAAASGVASVVGWVAAFIGSVFSLWTILWLFFGCASAYKIGADVGG